MLSRIQWIKKSNYKSLIYRCILKITPISYQEKINYFLKNKFKDEVYLFENSGLIEHRERLNGICAVIRATPQYQPLILSINSIIHHVDQIVIAFNGETPENFEETAIEILGNNSFKKIKLINYKTPILPPGINYYSEVKKNPELSIAKFYNFAFSASDYNTVIKWDDDMLAINHEYFIKTPKYIYSSLFIDGLDINSKKTTYMEPRIFILRNKVGYFDSDFCERINLGLSLGKKIRKKCYVHLKLVRKNFMN